MRTGPHTATMHTGQGSRGQHIMNGCIQPHGEGGGQPSARKYRPEEGGDYEVHFESLMVHTQHGTVRYGTQGDK